MSEVTIKKILSDSGLTEKEGEVYLFLAKHAALKTREIATRLRKDKAQIFRTLKNLETKGLVESTLEFPTRYSAIPFETILDSNLKSKKEEISLIENTKKDLLNYLRNTRQLELESSLEKFIVIEGNERIHLKILDMIKNTNHRFSAIISSSKLIQEKKSSLLEALFVHPNIHFRFLTELSSQNLPYIKNLLTRTLESAVNLEGRTPELGLTLSTQMDIRDEEEALFFIKPAGNAPTSEKEVCLWTNCKPLIQAFNSVFENLWHNSTDILPKLNGIEKLTDETGIIKDPVTAEKKYLDILRSAKREIAAVTSPEGLWSYWKDISLLKELATRNVSIKIMAPITSGNLQAVEDLSTFCTVKHVTAAHLGTTIVDGQHMFQFSEPQRTRTATSAYFEILSTPMI